jgi:non-canonical purine NTP pyrophosphatase (RdgB/HAM1 family)
MRARSVLETVLYARDIEAAKRFYADILGLRLTRAVDDRFAFFQCGDAMLLIFNPEATRVQAASADTPPPHGTEGAGHACFAASPDELDVWRALLEKKGIAIEADFEWPGGGGRSIYFRDPAGNSLEFAEPRIWGLPRRSLKGAKLVVASHNPGKAREINELLGPYGVEAISAGTLGLPEPEETGTTFEANAELKSRAAAEASGIVSLADDSGICVAGLDGDPGIYSARWAGPAKDFAMAMRNVEEKLQAKGAASPEKRRAYFISVLSVCWPDGHVENFEGRVDGTLAWPPRGNKGFGYDPMFVPDGYDITFGEMEPDAKHRISHRARAFRKLVDELF